MDGPLAPISCASRSAYAPCSCPYEALCGLRMVMIEARDALASTLDRYSLADIVGRALRAHRAGGLPVPFSGEEV